MFFIRKRSDWEMPASEITPESSWLSRRALMQATGGSILGLPAIARAASEDIHGLKELRTRRATPAQSDQGFYSREKLTPYQDVTHYNNFYEFGIGKRDPARHAADFRVSPWSVRIDGEVAKPGVYTLEDILAPHTLEERIYRLRCVEAWSMVIPWIGFPLAALLRRFEPTSKARYVAFETLYDPERMPGQRRSFPGSLRWPYVEGLRIDEAMHPLSFMVVGLYGRELPGQNGAPLRLVVPWKYGFKSIKSIVAIRLTKNQPSTSWNLAAPGEYGFYSNVNPDVSHPRWSQAWERRLPGGLFRSNRIPTQLFNGYAAQVAGLYKNMDLRRNY